MSDTYTEWLTSDQLMTYARQVEPTFSVRQLETLRGQRLMPSPQRVGQRGLHPVRLSPPGTERRLTTLVGLRKRTKDVDQLRVLLWLVGSEEDLSEVRQALMNVLDQARVTIEEAAANEAKKKRLTGEPGEVYRESLALLARQVSDARSNSPLVRLASARGFRLPGIHGLLHVFVTGEAPDPSVGTGLDVERALGTMPRAVHDRVSRELPESEAPAAGPWHDGVPVDLTKLGQVCSLPALRTAVEQSSDEDLLYTRDAVGPLLKGLWLVADITGRLRPGNFLGLDVLRSRNRKASEYEAIMTVALCVSLLHSDLRDNLHVIVESARNFREEIRRVANMLSLPPDRLAPRLARVSRDRLRLLDAARDVVRRRPNSDRGPSA